MPPPPSGEPGVRVPLVDDEQRRRRFTYPGPLRSTRWPSQRSIAVGAPWPTRWLQRTTDVVASGVEEGDEHGQDPLGAAGHVHVGRAGEHGQLAVWHQLDRLDGV